MAEQPGDRPPDSGDLDPLPPKPRPAPASLPTIPGYELLDVLGSGGMGLVWKARRRDDGQLVALKMIKGGGLADPEQRTRFLDRECAAITRLRHPNVVAVFQVGEVQGLPYLAQEYVEGGNLAARIAGRPQDPRDAAALVQTLAEAVAYIHSQGIVHRDLKPANVLLAGDGTPKISDFGLAKLHDQTGPTLTKGFLGTLAYAAPEQASGDPKKVGPAVDVYALGVLLFELLTGRPPFAGDSDLAVLDRVLRDEPPPPSRFVRVPRDLENICLKCLEKNPGRRYAAAADLAADLGRFLASQQLVGPFPALWQRGLRWAWGRRAALAVAALVVVAVGLFWFAHRPPEPSPLPTDEDIRRQAQAMRLQLFARLFRARTPEGWFPLMLPYEGRRTDPHGDFWNLAQGLAALLATKEAPADKIRALGDGIARPFVSGKLIERAGKPLGWQTNGLRAYPIALTAQWTTCYLSRLLQRDDLDPEQRKSGRIWLDRTRVVLNQYRAEKPAGGWNLFVGQRDHAGWIYPSAMGLLALLESRKARGVAPADVDADDRSLHQTAEFLLQKWEKPAKGRGGWKDWKDGWNMEGEKYCDGLTLQLFAILLRAEDEAGVRLPDALLRHMADYLAHCADRPVDWELSSGELQAEFIDPVKGDKRTGNQRIVFTWYPWAVEASQRWLLRAQKNEVPASEVLGVRQALVWLVVERGQEALKHLDQSTTTTFEVAETLFCLSAVPLPLSP